VAGQLSSVSKMSQLRDLGVLPSSAFVNTALGLVTAPTVFVNNLRSCPMTGRYASARLVLVDALHNVSDLWRSVVASGGRSYDSSAYAMALAELRVAYQ
jgi:hypothetical protein